MIYIEKRSEADQIYLDLIFGKLLRKRLAALTERIDGIIDSHLTMIMLKPSIDILTALLQNLLTQ
jgi:hypothetical protein